MKNKLKAISLAVIAVQLVSVVSPVLAGGFLNQQPGINSTDVRSDATQQTYSGSASTMAAGIAGDSVEGWLNQYGTARVQLNIDDHGNWDQSSIDWLLPVYQSSKNMLFTQLGYRAPDGRKTANIGAGVRAFSNGWMYGANVFFDNDMTGNNRRVGIGGEAWHDYLKLSANTYFGLTNWHQSGDFESYDERPADGWDLRAEGYLPAYPQLGGKLVYEKYHGGDVALIDKSDRHRNPSAVTAGVSYTPIPLVTAGIDYRTGTGGQNEALFSINLRYQPGASWQAQTSPDAVRDIRMLSGSRTDLVERNNTIVLDYRKQEQDVLQLIFPAQLTGVERTTISFRPVINATNGVSRIELNSAALIAVGGKILSATPENVTLQLPGYQSQPVKLTGVVYDSKGHRSNVAETLISTTQTETQAALSVSSDKSSALANGIDAITYTITLKNSRGQPAAGETVNWSTTLGTLAAASGTTDSNGQTTVRLISPVAGSATVTASAGGLTQSAAPVIFTQAANVLTISADKASALANGSDAITYTITLKNSSGQPVTGETVNWSATFGSLAATSGTTNSSGQVSVTLVSAAEGNAIVTASTAGQISSASSVAFQNVFDAVVTPSATDAFDNPVVFTLTLKKNGQPLAGEAVAWSSSTSVNTLSSASGPTDSNGQATVVAYSPPGTGKVTVTARAAGVDASGTTDFTPVFIPPTL